MLNSEDRLYFIHIPKTAGTTLIPLLDARFSINEIFPAQLWEELANLPQEEFVHYRFFRGHFGGKGLDVFLPKPPVRITMLRHPLALSLSIYKFILREPNTLLHRLVAPRGLGFAEFLSQRETRAAITNKQVHNLCFELDYLPTQGPLSSHYEDLGQWRKKYKIRIPPEQLVARALEVLKSCAFFGLVENFDESMALMAWTFGWPPARQVQKLMVASQPIDSEIPEELAGRVYDVNKLDLKLYQEGKKIFEARLDAMLADLRRYAKGEEHVPGSFSENPGLVWQLLDRHYQHHLGLSSSPASSIYLTFNEPLLGAGWHRRETVSANNTTFRWSGPTTESFIDLPIQAIQDLKLEFRVVNALAVDIIDSLKVSANGFFLDLEISKNEGKTIKCYRTIIPKKIGDNSDGLIRLKFTVNRTLSPNALTPNNPDSRQVGIALNWLRVQPFRAS
ncbi:sulfotransferase family 2 domain-containing protein, partial [Nitrosococcus oceani]|uniref:sulfotransferase family 2 domain-containing protein n=1 Tax=Nitrosococcus oceani TaxID=1229 RepID=UPI0005685224